MHRSSTLFVPVLALAGCMPVADDEILDEEPVGTDTQYAIDPVTHEDGGGGSCGGTTPACEYTGPAGPVLTGTLRAKVRVLTHNAFGKDEIGCGSRMKSLGKHVAHAYPGFDIVSFQEHWGTSDFGFFTCEDELSDAMWSTGRYLNDDNYYRHYPIGEWYEGELDGGLSTFSLHPIVKFGQWEWSVKNEAALHGFTFARVKLHNTSPAVYLDVYNVHTLAASDGCDRTCRQGMLAQLRNKIHELSSTSGNPVLVMGDFNIGGPPTCTGNPGYGDIMQQLGSPRDLWLEAHPTSGGFTIDCQENRTLQKKEPGCKARERIDYIFLMTHPYFTNNPYAVRVRPETVKVVKWDGSAWANGFDHVADHFGLEATLEIRNPYQPPTVFTPPTSGTVKLP